jgi:HEPN domain-containing protein
MSGREDQRDHPATADIPDDVLRPERTLHQMFRLYVEPEIKRRQSSRSLPDQFSVVKAQVLFFEGKQPEVRLNDEVKISLVIKAARAIQAGEAISLSEIKHIEASELDLLDADAGQFTAIAFNDQWLIFFDFRQNKLKASNLVERAEQFCASAEHALGQEHFGPAIDNLFSACELAAKARPIASAMVRSDAKSHGSIHSGINIWRKLGNVDREFVEMFNELSRNREVARYDASSKGNLPGLVNAEMVAKARAEIAELKKRFRRFE